MAMCLDYQMVYAPRKKIVQYLRLQMIAAFTLLCVLVGKVWIKIEQTEIGYELGKVHNQWLSLDMERRELELQLSVMMRHDSLARTARTRLGLEPFNQKQVWKLED